MLISDWSSDVCSSVLFEDRLLLVSTDPSGRPEPGPDYVYVDWGPEFYARHSASFPNFIGPALSANIGWLGQQQVLAHGGSGYFPARLVRPHLESRSEEHTSELQQLMSISYAAFCLKQKKQRK